MSKAMLTICGCQYHADAQPEIIELTTEGTLTQTEAGWEIAYEESDLTGMEGVKTIFCIQPGSSLPLYLQPVQLFALPESTGQFATILSAYAGYCSIRARR